MIPNKLYYPDSTDIEGGGNNSPKKKETRVSTTPIQRRDWNDFLDYLQRAGVAGSKDLDQLDKNALKPHLDQYRKDNPNTSVSEDLIPVVQREHEELRTGDSFAGMSPEQTRVMRKQFNDAFVSRAIARQGLPFDSTLSRQYYPTFKKGDKDYGTDAEAYMKDFATIPAKGGGGSGKDDSIPKPDYKNQASRNAFLQKWQKKYGDLQGRGDTVLKVNEIPRGGSSSAKDISVKAASKYGIDPALLYSSAMEEGMSGLFKDKSGVDTKHRKPTDAGYQDFFGDKEFPVNGANSFGLNTIEERLPELIKGGYLPKDFAKNIRGKANEGQYSSWDFKNVESAMQAKAAILKEGRDEVDKYAGQHGITLSPKAKDFFMLAVYNGGEGAMKRMLQYQKDGLLEDDKFLKSRPKSEESVKGQTSDVYGHIIPRINMANALKKEKLFEDEN